MKHLKDLTKYSGMDKFKTFRETLVNEVQENLEIIDEKLEGLNQTMNTVATILDEINGEVV